jgi:hypothetical protein
MKPNKITLSAFLVCSTLFFVNAQNTSHHKPRKVGSFNRMIDVSPDERFTCIKLFKDTTGKSKIRFSKVVMTTYTSKDSVLGNKRESGKWIVRFNMTGEASSWVVLDSMGRATDSVSILYDPNFNMIRQMKYDTKNAEGQLQLKSDENITRNAKGEMLMDSTWKKNTESTKDNEKDYSISTVYRTYDKAGNCIKHTSIDDNDTSISLFEYDKKNREIKLRSYDYHKWNTVFNKYDDSSNVIEYIRISEGPKADTEKTYRTFDKQNRKTSIIRYSNSKLTSKDTYEYANDGGYTETEVSNSTGITGGAFGGNKDGECETDHTTITVYDRYKNEVSETDKRVKGSESFTSTELHKYVYTPNGDIISDTEIDAEQSKWHNATTLKVNMNKYDAKGNLTEEAKMGGENLTISSKKTYKYNDKDKLLQTDYYTSCTDKPEHSDITVYYADEVTPKEEIKSMGTYGKTITRYGKDTRMLEMSTIYATFCYQILVDYYQ